MSSPDPPPQFSRPRRPPGYEHRLPSLPGCAKLARRKRHWRAKSAMHPGWAGWSVLLLRSARSPPQTACFFGRREDFGPRGTTGFRLRMHPRQGLQRRLLDPPWPIRLRADQGLYILVAAQFTRPWRAAPESPYTGSSAQRAGQTRRDEKTSRRYSGQVAAARREPT